MSKDQILHEELYRGVQRDYDLAFNAHAQAMNDLRAAERVAGYTLDRSGQTLEALPYSLRGQR